MIIKRTKILLILYNASSHPFVKLHNIEPMFFTKNTGSIMHSSDMVKIKAIKCHYFNELFNSCIMKSLILYLTFLDP